ncbi:thread biopolymer filament subunit alpha-like, partial [Scleropages formosus]
QHESKLLIHNSYDTADLDASVCDAGSCTARLGQRPPAWRTELFTSERKTFCTLRMRRDLFAASGYRGAAQAAAPPSHPQPRHSRPICGTLALPRVCVRVRPSRTKAPRGARRPHAGPSSFAAVRRSTGPDARRGASPLADDALTVFRCESALGVCPTAASDAVQAEEPVHTLRTFWVSASLGSVRASRTRTGFAAVPHRRLRAMAVNTAAPGLSSCTSLMDTFGSASERTDSGPDLRGSLRRALLRVTLYLSQVSGDPPGRCSPGEPPCCCRSTFGDGLLGVVPGNGQGGNETRAQNRSRGRKEMVPVAGPRPHGRTHKRRHGALEPATTYNYFSVPETSTVPQHRYVFVDLPDEHAHKEEKKASGKEASASAGGRAEPKRQDAAAMELQKQSRSARWPGARFLTAFQKNAEPSWQRSQKGAFLLFIMKEDREDIVFIFTTSGARVVFDLPSCLREAQLSARGLQDGQRICGRYLQELTSPYSPARALYSSSSVCLVAPRRRPSALGRAPPQTRFLGVPRASLSAVSMSPSGGDIRIRNVKLQGGAVRFGAMYGGNRLFSGARGSGGGIGLATSRSLGTSGLAGSGPGFRGADTVQVTRLKEKEELQVLNNKFASFIDKARSLEQCNAILKAKISMFTNPDQGGPASTSIILTSAIGSYKTQIDNLTATKEGILAEIEHYKGIIDDIQTRLEEETSQTKALETDWTHLKEVSLLFGLARTIRRKMLRCQQAARCRLYLYLYLYPYLCLYLQEVDNLYLAIFELQTNIGGVEEQIVLNKQVYDAKVKEVRNIVTGGLKSAVSISVDNAAQAQDLTSALAEVKAHYEALAQRSKQDAFLTVQDSVRESFFSYPPFRRRSSSPVRVPVCSQLSLLSLSAQPGAQSLPNMKEELRVYKLQIDSVQREIDRIKTLNHQLQEQVDEAESSSDSHRETHQDQILTLKSQLDDIRKQLAQYGQEYQELLASKMSLEVEITAYKKLLDSEENR